MRRYTHRMVEAFAARNGLDDANLPTPAELAADDLAAEKRYEARQRAYDRGDIRITPWLTRESPLCSERPHDAASACLRNEDHEGEHTVAKLMRHGRGADLFTVADGELVPFRSMTTRYSRPTRAELAEELALAEAYERGDDRVPF